MKSTNEAYYKLTILLFYFYNKLAKKADGWSLKRKGVHCIRKFKLQRRYQIWRSLWLSSLILCLFYHRCSQNKLKNSIFIFCLYKLTFSSSVGNRLLSPRHYNTNKTDTLLIYRDFNLFMPNCSVEEKIKLGR